MKLTKREIWALHKMLDWHIARYLMSVTFGRRDGSERADEHIKISEILAGFLFADGDYGKVRDSTMKIHDHLARILTDRMDEVINFPIDCPIYGSDYDQYNDAFFKVLIDNIDGIFKVAKAAVKERRK